MTMCDALGAALHCTMQPGKDFRLLLLALQLLAHTFQQTTPFSA